MPNVQILLFQPKLSEPELPAVVMETVPARYCAFHVKRSCAELCRFVQFSNANSWKDFFFFKRTKVSEGQHKAETPSGGGAHGKDGKTQSRRVISGYAFTDMETLYVGLGEVRSPTVLPCA